MAKFIDRTGFRYGMLTVVEYSHANNGAYWKCLCDCGNESIVKGGSLTIGSTKSCGCGSIKQAITNCKSSAIKRRSSYPNVRKLKELYRSIKDRCYNQNNKRYANYGGRGIKVCKEWLNDRQKFYAWVHKNKHDSKLQIDRIDNNGNYEPSNCRFVDAITQANNTTRNHFIEWGGKRLTIRQWERKLGMPRQVLQHRMDRSWDLERAMTKPVRRHPSRPND